MQKTPVEGVGIEIMEHAVLLQDITVSSLMKISLLKDM